MKIFLMLLCIRFFQTKYIKMHVITQRQHTIDLDCVYLLHYLLKEIHLLFIQKENAKEWWNHSLRTCSISWNQP